MTITLAELKAKLSALEFNHSEQVKELRKQIEELKNQPPKPRLLEEGKTVSCYPMHLKVLDGWGGRISIVHEGLNDWCVVIKRSFGSKEAALEKARQIIEGGSSD